MQSSSASPTIVRYRVAREATARRDGAREPLLRLATQELSGGAARPQYSTDGSHAPLGSRYSPSAIRFIGFTRRRPSSRHHRNKPVRSGTRKASGSSTAAAAPCSSAVISSSPSATPWLSGQKVTLEA